MLFIPFLLDSSNLSALSMAIR